MKNLKLFIIVLSIVLQLSCKDRSFSKLINVDKWNEATMQILTKKMHLDTCLKYIPVIQISDDTTVIKNFTEHMGYKFSKRKSFIEFIKKQRDISFQYPLHIQEFYGRNSFGSIEYSYTIYENYRRMYCFKLNFLKGSFEQENLDGEKCFWLYLQRFKSIIEYGVLADIEIITLIKPKKNNDLNYNVIQVWAD